MRDNAIPARIFVHVYFFTDVMGVVLLSFIFFSICIQNYITHVYILYSLINNGIVAPPFYLST